MEQSTEGRNEPKQICSTDFGQKLFKGGVRAFSTKGYLDDWTIYIGNKMNIDLNINLYRKVNSN
jgi:hypothetical protein